MASFDFSIPGDELEQHRIQLEHNLQQQQTDISLHLSSEDHYHSHRDEDSIEYPRHNSRPSPHSFASFEFPSRTHDMEMDGPSALHAWSYRTGDDDDEGVNPYGAETLSTAAHHASALTLSAGLGGRGGRRDVSLSGAEFDPERPLQNMISGVGSKFSGLDLDPSRSKSVAAAVDFDPLVVDDTAELDRLLSFGGAPPSIPSITRFRSPHSSASSSAGSDSDGSQSRPRLADALQRVAFSPKRPRSAQGIRLPSGAQRPASPLVRSTRRPSSPLVRTDSDPTPKPARKRQIFPSNGPTPVKSQPRVEVQPPTPSTARSEFTRMARGLAREIGAEADRSRWHEQVHDEKEDVAQPLAQSTVRGQGHPRSPFVDMVNQQLPARRKKTQRGVSGRVHLPDVTGLTSAVESPMKGAAGYMGYSGEEEPREVEARLLHTLSLVQSQLAHLESENGISRRRVMELEKELEICKGEVARERTRVMEREKEDVVRMQKQRKEEEKERRGKQREKEREEAEKSVRYKEVVEEKKALEALIGTLRAHLTRLTSELSSHQALLAELRALRDADQRTLQEKAREVERLRAEVERLAGEVEVLRGVVEEGLRERRGREMLHVAVGADQQTEDEEEDEGLGRSGEMEENCSGDTEIIEDEAEDEDEDEDDDYVPDAESSRRPSLKPDLTYRTAEPDVSSFTHRSYSRRQPIPAADRTGYATIGTSQATPVASSATQPFISGAELERISVELEERRSERSASLSHTRSRSSTPVLQRSVSIASSRHKEGDQSRFTAERTASPTLGRRPPLHQDARVRTDSPPPQASSSRPPAPTPAHAAGTGRPEVPNEATETPFPQIRGGHLERLFFSAPEHNAKTCTVCHRRRRNRPVSPSVNQPASWLPGRRGREYKAGVVDTDDDEDNDDEGFAEGPDEAERAAVNRMLREAKGKARQRDPSRKVAAEQDRLPPQTVLARVLRELEDDFTHYKGIYVELADQYKVMDAASNVPKRNILAQHLREVVDILEQKGDQIASLYDLLSFKDKPVSESVVPPKQGRSVPVETSSWGRSRGLKKHPTFA